MERLITVEKALLELRLEDYPERHPDDGALHTRQANSEGVGEVTARPMVELTRRLNPDRVIVGELVEDEALDMLDVASMCKARLNRNHPRAPADIVLTRLAYYVSKSNTRLPEYAVWNHIAGTVDFVVHIDLVRNAVEEQAAVRRVTSIIEVGGLGEAGGVSSTEVWTIDDTDELVQVAPLSQRHLNRLRIAGYDPICSPREVPGEHRVRHPRRSRRWRESLRWSSCSARPATSRTTAVRRRSFPDSLRRWASARSC